jgi:putative zinc finger protein
MTESDLTCQVAVRLMPEYLDDELPERQIVRLEQHLVVCPGCSTYLDQLRRTVAAVAGLRGDRLPGQVWEGIAARLHGGSEPGVEPADQVVAYKFLSADRMSPFARVRWPEPGGGWVVASATVGTCRRAVHACRIQDLAYWLGERLWRVELAGQVADSPSKIVAERGRLVDQVDGWPEASGAFIQDCTARVEQFREHAKQQRDYRAARYLDAYVAELDGDSDPASVSYTAAHAAGIVSWLPGEAPASADDEHSPLDAERRRQSRWLAAALGLEP